MSITPETGTTAAVTAPFIADHAYDETVDGPVEGPVDPLRLTVAREAVGDAWRVTITAHP